MVECTQQRIPIIIIPCDAEMQCVVQCMQTFERTVKTNIYYNDVSLLQNVLHYSSFASTKKSSDNSHWKFLFLVCPTYGLVIIKQIDAFIVCHFVRLY